MRALKLVAALSLAGAVSAIPFAGSQAAPMTPLSAGIYRDVHV